MLIVDPIRKYMNSKEGSGEVCPVQSMPVLLTVGVDRQIIAAVSSKKIRVMGWIFNSDAAGVSRIAFKNGSGGSFLAVDYSSDILPPTKQDLVDSGYFETSTGVGLYCDLATTDAYVTVFYITYTG